MTKLDDLSDDPLMEVLDRVLPEDLFKLLRVNKQFNRVATIKMGLKIKAIALTNNSLKSFSDCVHLGAISPDQVLVLDKLVKPSVKKRSPQPSKNFLLNVLAKCEGVKSIDFHSLELKQNRGLLLEAFKLCPELECIKLGPSIACDDSVQLQQWQSALKQNGHRLVHFVKHSEVTWDLWPLATVAEKCTNMKHFDLMLKLVSRDFILGRRYEFDDQTVGTLEKMPKTCWTKLKLDDIHIYEDVFDELDIDRFECFVEEPRLTRLSVLKTKKFLSIWTHCHGIDFAGLKKFDFSTNKKYDDRSIDYLLNSRFPLLEEFCFNANNGLTQDDYEELFQLMASVRKLTIVWNWSKKDEMQQLLGSTIHKLDNLETVELMIGRTLTKLKPKNFLKFEQYVVGFKSLKKLVVDMKKCRGTGWQKAVADDVKEMDLMQSGVEVVFVF